MRALGVLIALGAIFVSLWADNGWSRPVEDRRLSFAYRKCTLIADGVTISTRACMSSEQDRLDRVLRHAYSLLLRRIGDPTERAALANSQRTWSEHQRAQCELKLWDPGGTYGQVLADDCGLETTLDRIDFLRNYHKPGE